MKFCSNCGANITILIPPGDNLPRHVCTSCETVHYQNPKIVAGCIPEWDDQILLCRRAIEPRHGKWTLPAGFMENKETTLECAAREAHEEANAKMGQLSLYTVFNLPHISQVYMLFRGELLLGLASPGFESLEVRLFKEEEIPWGELAFPVIDETLRLYYRDRRQGVFKLHVGDIFRNERDEIEIHHHP